MSDLIDTLEAILREELILEPPGPDADLFESGLIDSLGLITLIYEVEQRCGVTLPFEDLEIEDFSTIRSIASLIEAHSSAEGSK